MVQSSFFDLSMDQVSGVLTPHASFLANIEDPIAYVETEEGEKYYAPHPEIFELIVWNIVVAFWVNVAASYIYEAYVSKPGKLLDRQELRIAQEAIEKELGVSKSQERSKGLRLLLGDKFKVEASFVERTTEFLSYHGWPTDEAARDARRASELLLQIAQEAKSEDCTEQVDQDTH